MSIIFEDMIGRFILSLWSSKCVSSLPPFVIFSGIFNDREGAILSLVKVDNFGAELFSTLLIFSKDKGLMEVLVSWLNSSLLVEANETDSSGLIFIPNGGTDEFEKSFSIGKSP